MDTFAYKLRFTSPLHISSSSANYEQAETVVHSDTLYSALCAVAAQLYDDSVWKPVFLPQTGQCPIRLSSAMPYWGRTFFLPKPMGFTPCDFEQWDYVQQKKWKRVSWLSWSTLADIAGGARQLSLVDLKQQVRSGCYFSPLEINGTASGSLYTFREVPRVTLDRLSNNPTLFFYGDITFSEGAGLYVLAQFEDEQSRLLFETVLRVLGDTGLGGDRTVGKGLFEAEKLETTVALPSAPDADTHLLLSLYTPTANELAYLQADKSFYQLMSRQGWVSGRTFRRQTVRAFTEGSILSMPGIDGPEGRLQAVLPSSFTGFTVYRYLKAFSVPFKNA